eukprot:m.470669 g.470669  ORF g.470669 m.470669 type:complete len:422 (-) comp30101_c0_seq1:337-1602(-)
MHKLKESILQADGDKVLIKMMTTIDSRNAQASQEDDMRKIRELIEGLEGSYLAVNNMYKQVTRTWMLSALETLLQTFPADSSEAGQFAFASGAILQGAGDYDASIDFFRTALELKSAMHGEHHPEVAHIYNRLAVVYSGHRNVKMVVERAHRAKSIFASLGYEREYQTGVAEACNTLGLLYAADGNADQACMFHREALRMRQVIHGDVHPEIAESHCNLGKVHFISDNNAAAIDSHTMTLNMRSQLRESCPDIVADMATSHNHVGEASREVGLFEEAMWHHAEALAIQNVVLGPNHPDVSVTHTKTGLLHELQGDFIAAKQCHGKALDLRLKVLTPKHPAIAESMCCLSVACAELGEYEQATQHMHQAFRLIAVVVEPKNDSNTTAPTPSNNKTFRCATPGNDRPAAASNRRTYINVLKPT